MFPALVTNREGDNPQQTPSVTNVKAAFLGNQEYRFFFLTDQYVAVSMNSASVLQSKLFHALSFSFGHFNTMKYILLQINVFIPTNKWKLLFKYIVQILQKSPFIIVHGLKLLVSSSLSTAWKPLFSEVVLFHTVSQSLAGFQVSYITCDGRKVRLPAKSAIFSV